MNAFALIDMYATKGIEYLVVIAYLGMLGGFWFMLNRVGRARRPAIARQPSRWFTVPDGVYLHAGHTWVRPNGGPVHIGFDDFATRLVGPPERIDLPEVGERVEAGTVGWQITRQGQLLDVLSPLSGEVVAVNEDMLTDPSRHWSDPYDAGWLMKVRPDHGKKSVRDLVSGERARQWMDDVTAQLMERIPSPVGAVLQDGGVPVDGIAQELEPENWVPMVEDFLGTHREN